MLKGGFDFYMNKEASKRLHLGEVYISRWARLASQQTKLLVRDN